MTQQPMFSSATTTFEQRHILSNPSSFSEVDQAVIRCLPKGSKILECVSWKSSAWTSTFKISARTAENVDIAYFMKTAQERGAVMMQGEFKSLTAINDAVPGLAPRPLGWGKFDESESYYVVMEFLDMDVLLPDPVGLCRAVAEMHQRSQSPTGMFGFHMPTCQGRHVQANKWDASWCRYFTKLIAVFFDTDMSLNGHWKEYEDAFQTLRTTTIPRILEPLQTDRRVLKPCLVHGDLWEENTGTRETGELVVYDASVMYAHNEYELGMWRCEHTKLGPDYIEEYLRHVPPSEPREQFEDRVRLYSVKFSLAHSSGWSGLVGVREKILEDMDYLNRKYGADGVNGVV
ncbi:Fructosamine kinase-domain-containing protein [Xylariaceae sp. FL1272]|nr:Fructosamine kinase-domain-containing protein [Xylariaceae sp. FL1272]